MRWLAVLTTIVQAASPPSPSEDSVRAIRREARRAEAEYEMLVRRMAPATLGSGSTGPCDEIVGRFCLRFSDGIERPIDPEAGRVTRARWAAVQALRRAFALEPEALTTAGPLVRYLVEGDRASEAVSAAEAFAWASGDSIWGPAVVAFAHHAKGEDSIAQRKFGVALEAMDDELRRRFTRVDVLLDWDERRLYRQLDEGERERYEAELWRAADPLYLTPANEAWVEHLARGVWAWFLARAPVVTGMVRWGEDLDELTLRYGTPAGRKRELGMRLGEVRMIEQFDPDQLPFVPSALRLAGIPTAPPPGDPSPLDEPRVRSAHSPRTVRRVIPMTHQLSRFPRGDSILVRVDGALLLDSVASAGRIASGSPAPDVASGLFVLTPEYHVVSEARGRVHVASDTVTLSHVLKTAMGSRIYSLEAIESETGLAGRARYAAELTLPASGRLVVSDLLVAEPFGDGARPNEPVDTLLRARPSLTVPAGEDIGLYAEVHGLASTRSGATEYRVTLSVQAPDGPVLVRAARWLGRKLGLAGPRSEPRLIWEASGSERVPEIIAVDLDFSALRPGLHRIEVSVADLIAGTESIAVRPIRIEDPPR